MKAMAVVTEDGASGMMKDLITVHTVLQRNVRVAGTCVTRLFIRLLIAAMV